MINRGINPLKMCTRTLLLLPEKSLISGVLGEGNYEHLTKIKDYKKKKDKNKNTKQVLTLIRETLLEGRYLTNHLKIRIRENLYRL